MKLLAPTVRLTSLLASHAHVGRGGLDVRVFLVSSVLVSRLYVDRGELTAGQAVDVASVDVV